MQQWTWDAVNPKDEVAKSFRALNTRMAALQGFLARVLGLEAQVQARAATTDATVTTLATEAIPVGTTMVVSGLVAARRTGGSSGSTEDGAGYRVEFVAKNAAGTAAIIGSSVTVIGESQAGWDVTLTVSGGNVLVRVTGAANNAITWHWARWSLATSS